MPIVVDIRTVGPPAVLLRAAGLDVGNSEWARRKINVVKMFHKSTYRMVLEQEREDRTFPVGEALPIEDYVLAGGGFPDPGQGRWA